MAELSVLDKKIRIQGNGIKISPELEAELHQEGYYPIALTWIADDVTGPFSFAGYGDRSPLELKRVDGELQVWENGEFFSSVDYYKRPQFFNCQWVPPGGDGNEGTVFIDEGISGVIPREGRNHKTEEGDIFKVIQAGSFPFMILACYNGLVIWSSWGCLYAKQNVPCKFCCLPEGYNENRIVANQPEWFEGLADAFELALKEIGPEIGTCSITVDSGTLPGRDKGARTYIRVLESLRKRIGPLPETLYTRAVIEPPLDEEWLYALREAGYDSIQMDVDVYTEEDRRRVMPNAKGLRPVGDYEKALSKAKEIFPKEVATQLIVGIQRDEDVLKGVERFARIGVPTLVSPFLPYGHGARFRQEEGVQVPEEDRMKRLYDRSAEILIRYNVPAPEFRGGISTLPETMGRRLKRNHCFTNSR